MKKAKKVRTRRRMTSAELWLLCIALPIISAIGISAVIALVVMAVNFF